MLLDGDGAADGEGTRSGVRAGLGGMGWGGWVVGVGIPGSRHTFMPGGIAYSPFGWDFIHPALSVVLHFTADISITALMPRTCMRGPESTTQRPRAILTAVQRAGAPRGAFHSGRPWLGQAALVAEPTGAASVAAASTEAGRLPRWWRRRRWPRPLNNRAAGGRENAPLFRWTRKFAFICAKNW